MHSTPAVSRRSLLKQAAGAAGAAIAFPYIVPATSLGRAGSVAPSNRVTVGCIGVGGQGLYDMSRMFEVPDVQVVAVCDPYASKREAAKKAVNDFYKKDGCAAFNDFRELVARSDLDVVQIATPDHWHVLCALAAVRSGKDVYVEKPLGLSIAEDQALREACRRHGRIFQFGTQQRSSPQFHQACELALNGRIGKLHTIKVSAPSGFQERTNEPTWSAAPVPEGFDYERWLGPAPSAPYTPKRCVTPHWYHISDYAIGYIGGWAIHHMDIAHWGMNDQAHPVEIEGSGVFADDEGLCDTPLNWDIHMTYSNGMRLHLTSDGGPNQHGCRFEGDKGWIHVDRSRIVAEPASVLQEKIGPDEVRLHKSGHHQRDLIEAFKSRRQPVCNIEVAVRSDIACHLGYLAVCLGRKLRWDPRKEQFINDDAANARLSRAMRSPWHL